MHIVPHWDRMQIHCPIHLRADIGTPANYPKVAYNAHWLSHRNKQTRANVPRVRTQAPRVYCDNFIAYDIFVAKRKRKIGSRGVASIETKATADFSVDDEMRNRVACALVALVDFANALSQVTASDSNEEAA